MRVLSVAVLCLIVWGCEDKNNDKVYAAQECLDRATPATVDACVAKIAGVTSSHAYIIRCSADFLRQSIDEDKIITAVENLDKNDGSQGTDPNLTLYDAFFFSDLNGDIALDLVNSAVANCAATGAATLQALALTAKVATILKGLAGVGTIAAYIGGLSDGNIDNLATTNAAEIQAIGETILAMHPLACSKTGSFEGTEVCDNINTAINGATPAQIATEYLKKLKTSNN